MTRADTKQLRLLQKQSDLANQLEAENILARRALDLRRRGKSWWQIAEALKLPETQVQDMGASAIRAASLLVSDATRLEMQALEVMRLDSLQDALWDDAMAGDTRAVDSIVRIIMSRAKLTGLDEHAPTGQVNAVVVQGHSEEYLAALKAIASSGVVK